MKFSNDDLMDTSSPELHKIIETMMDLTRNGTSGYKNNVDTSIKLFDKMLVLSKKEKAWYIYFHTLYEMLFVQSKFGSKKKAVQYAELFYRDHAMYMDEAIPKYTGTDFHKYNGYICDAIFEVYCEIYQIQDNKMKEFMEFFENVSKKYDGRGDYYRDVLRLALLYNDKEMAEKAVEGYEKCKVESCYVCEHIPYLGYYLMKDDAESAKGLIEQLVSKDIPKIHQWCYKYCAVANEYELYFRMLSYCLLTGKPEIFHEYLPIYWETAKEKEDEGADIYLFEAIQGDFRALDKALNCVIQNLEECKKSTTFIQICDWLCWYCYFTLINQNGIHTVVFDKEEESLPKKDKNGKYSSLALAAYFEERADKMGSLFANSRKQFDYNKMKRTYQECAGL